MAVYKRGKASYQANFQLKGKRFRETFNSREEAEAWEAQCRASIALGKPLPTVKSKASITTIKDLVRHVDRRHWSKKKSGPTLSRRAYIFAEWVGENMPVTHALDEDVIEDFFHIRETEYNNSGSTVNRFRASISKISSEAVRLGLIDRKPFMQIRPEGQARDRIFSEQEEQQILEVTRMWGYPDHADLFIFLCDTGCRLAEAEKLTWKDFRGNLLEIPGTITKSGRGRVIALTSRVEEALKRQRRHSLPGPFHWHNRYTTRTLWDRLRGHFPWMGNDCVLHTYRHTCASRLVQEQGYLDPVQRWLGHTTPVTTQRYAKYAPKNMEDLASLLEARQRRENKLPA